MLFRRRRQQRAKVKELLRGRACVDCNEADPIVLQFDHVRGIKRDAVSNLVTRNVAWSTIEAEMAKCEIRCANCHIRRTAKQQGWYQ
jgi:hypothetical protein